MLNALLNKISPSFLPSFLVMKMEILGLKLAQVAELIVVGRGRSCVIMFSSFKLKNKSHKLISHRLVCCHSNVNSLMPATLPVSRTTVDLNLGPGRSSVHMQC